ncbi:MAG: replication-associated recombination protein A [Bacteroidota bacterium]
MQSRKPLAEQLRPQTLDEYIGQEHLAGAGSALRKAIDTGQIPSMILWGPPGTGKTTLARIIANTLFRPFYTLSAVSSGVKDVREVITKAKQGGGGAILFIDEIHRFSKSQQDSLLNAVEEGIVTLIGATTENPSFEVISPLLSRAQVYVLKPLEESDLLKILDLAVEHYKKKYAVNVALKETDALLKISGGDARKLLNAFELAESMLRSGSGKSVLTNEAVQQVIQENLARYDKTGEMHYDIISAFIKSVRGSDPDAAVYWLARMIEGGEEPKFIARRLLILAAEDIGLANPNALLMAQNCFKAVEAVGFPEGRIILSEATIYLASSPKSNSAYQAINEAQQKVKETGDLPVPLHLRNAPTKLMKNLNYGKEYKYAHSYPGNFVEQQFMPDTLKDARFYKPQNNPQENSILKRLKFWWKTRFDK